MMAKIYLLILFALASFGFSNDGNCEIESYNNSYGDHLTTPFEMNHHVTTYLDTNAGYLYIAGDNRYYNLGNNTTTNSKLYFPAYKNGDSNEKFINPVSWDFEIYHSAIVDNDGSLWMSGRGTDGMLATGSSTSLTVFTQVETPNNKKVVKVCVSRGNATIILLEDESVWAIGSTSSLGISGANSAWTQVDTLLPVDDNKIIDFQGGYQATFFLTSEGNLYGAGTSTDVGGGSTSFTIPKLTDVCQIDLMYQTTFALKNDGTVWGTGSNSYGQLGIGTRTTMYKFTQANLSLLEDEFPVLLKGGIHTGYFLTNLGNMYIAGSDSDGQYGDGTTNSVSSEFKLIHEDVAYFDVGEYQTGVLFKDSSLKFFGQNDLGQLGIGTTTDVHDAYSDEAKLISPLAENLGSGLIPAVTLATYTPDLSSWPTTCADALTTEQIEAYSESTVPIRPGQEHEDGSTNTFISDDGGVYIFSSPALVNSKSDVIDTYVFNSGEFVNVFYNDLNLESGILSGYTVNISIESEDKIYNSTFNYGSEQLILDNYPKQVGTYIVTTTLLNSKNEIKTTTETSYEISCATYNPSLIKTNLKDELESLYIIKDDNNIDDFNNTILKGIQDGSFVSGDFVQVSGSDTQSYIDGKFNDLTLNEITIEYKFNGENTTQITTNGNYIVYVKIEPFGYESEYLQIAFTIDESKVLIHNEIILDDNIIFGDIYTIDLNNSVLSETQTLYIQFKNENGIISEFEATSENVNSFRLFPKEAGNYIVSSIIKEGDLVVSTKETQYTVNKKAAQLTNDTTEYLQQDDFTINDIIIYYSKNKLTINNEVVTSTLVVSNNLYEIVENNYNYVIYNSKKEVVSDINKTDTYTIEISLDNENYEVNTVTHSFDIVVPQTTNNTIFIILFVIVLLTSSIIFVIYKKKNS